jgi:hypothetical protein
MVTKEQKVVYTKETPYNERLTDIINEYLKQGFFIVSVTAQNVAGTGRYIDGGFLIVFERTVLE